MSSFRQIEANRRNARLSTDPVTEEGKRRSRQNAVRHGLTAETVIDALEDAEDYAAFEMAVTADYDAQSAVERELVLRLANLLSRLRRATAIESGLFKFQALHLLQFRQHRWAHEKRREITDSVYRNGLATEEDMQQDDDGPSSSTPDPGPSSAVDSADPSDDLTRDFVRLSNLPTYPLDRLSRYEATLWRQAYQILFALQCLDRIRLRERLARAYQPANQNGACTGSNHIGSLRLLAKQPELFGPKSEQKKCKWERECLHSPGIARIDSNCRVESNHPKQR
jgi:hypothetical protein